MTSKPKQFEGRLYLGRDDAGREQYEWLGRFPRLRNATTRSAAAAGSESRARAREAPARGADHLPRVRRPIPQQDGVRGAANEGRQDIQGLERWHGEGTAQAVDSRVR